MNINHLNLTHKKGNQLKQGDYATELVFELRNYQNRLVKKYDGKEATVRVGNEFEKKVTVKGHEIEFTIDVLLEVGEYPVEVYIDNLVFPSDHSAYIVVRKGLKNYDLTYMFKSLKIDTDALEDAIIKLSTIDSDFIVNAINNGNLKIKADKIEGLVTPDTLKSGDSIFLEKISNLVDSLKTILEKINGKDNVNVEPKETDETRIGEETEKVDLSLYETIEQANKTKEELNLLISSLRSDVERLNTSSSQPVQPDNTELNKVKETIESLNQAIKDSKESVLAEIKKSIEDVKSEVQTISDKVDTFDGRIGEVERKNVAYDDSELKRRITDLEGKSGSNSEIKLSEELFERLSLTEESEKTLDNLLQQILNYIDEIDIRSSGLLDSESDNLLNESLLYNKRNDKYFYTTLFQGETMTLSTNIPDDNIVKWNISRTEISEQPKVIIINEGYVYKNHPITLNRSDYPDVNIKNIYIEILDSSYVKKLQSGEYWIMLNLGETAKTYKPYIEETIGEAF